MEIRTVRITKQRLLMWLVFWLLKTIMKNMAAEMAQRSA
jgi:hypothetical protein